MLSRKKTGTAYTICGMIILLLSLFAGLAGWKLIAGILIGALLTIIGLLLSSSKKKLAF